MTERIKQNADKIAQIIKETESILKDRYESDYRKGQSMIVAYEEIAELVKGEQG